VPRYFGLGVDAKEFGEGFERVVAHLELVPGQKDRVDQLSGRQGFKVPLGQAGSEEGNVEAVAVVGDPDVVLAELVHDGPDDGAVVGAVRFPFRIEPVGAEDFGTANGGLDDGAKDDAEVGVEAGGFDVEATAGDLFLFHAVSMAKMRRQAAWVRWSS